MENKYLKAKEFKLFIQKQKQMLKQSKEFIDKSGIELCGTNDYYQVHVYGAKSFYRLSKMLRLTPMETSGYGEGQFELYFYYEGIKIFCLTSKSNHKSRRYDYMANIYREEFAKLFVETEDKEVAFQKLKEMREKKEYEDIKYLSCYADFQKYLRRHSNQRYDSKENIESKYLGYKNNFEPLNDDESMTWTEAKRRRPNGDYYIPLSFSQWYKANY